MKFRITILAALISVAGLWCNAQSEQQRINDAILKVYAEELKEEPENYNVYFRRAHTLYTLNRYSQALSDIDNAIKYAPPTDKDLLSQAYALKANIYLMLEKPAEALVPMSKAVECDPSSYTLLYQKANIEYEIGEYQAAKEDFRRLQRIHHRSLESLIGLARIAIKENNLGLANEYADQAVALYPAEGDAYLRRASVRALLGNNTGAVDDMLMALSLNPKNSKAISQMVAMSASDYNAVISALSGAISQAPDKGIFYYIRAMIAQGHYHYIAAIDDYNTIIARNLDNYHGIYASLAECYLALCDFDKALDEINHAIGSTINNGSYYIINSRIHYAKGEYGAALKNAERALEKLPDNTEALIQRANCLAAMGRYEDASAALGEAIIVDPENPLSYIIRGWILSEKLNKKSDAEKFLRRCLDLENVDKNEYSAAKSARSLKGFAMMMLGDKDGAKEWAEKLVAPGTTDVDGRIHYIASCLLCHLGDDEIALDSMLYALGKGYSNLYDWMRYDIATVNVAPLRTNPEFESLLKSYDYLFKK